MFVIRILVVIFLACTLAACKDESRQGYVELTGRIFIFNVRLSRATYMVTLAVRKPLPVGAKVIAHLDDPAGGPRIKLEQNISPAMDNISFESDALQCVKKGKRYAFDVTVLDAGGATLQSISSSIESTLDQSVLADVPLVVGPGYERNPELDGNGTGRLPGKPKPECPL